MPENTARLEFEGQLNEGKLQLQMDLSPFGNDVKAAGRIKLKGLSLAPFAQLLAPHLKSLEGRLDADLNIETGQIVRHRLQPPSERSIEPAIRCACRSRIATSPIKALTGTGLMRIDIPKTAQTLKIAANGRLNGSQLALASQNEDPQIQQEASNLGGQG